MEKQSKDKPVYKCGCGTVLRMTDDGPYCGNCERFRDAEPGPGQLSAEDIEVNCGHEADWTACVVCIRKALARVEKRLVNLQAALDGERAFIKGYREGASKQSEENHKYIDELKKRIEVMEAEKKGKGSDGTP